MSHEPGRERFMTHKCECCGGDFGDPIYVPDADEYWCPDCIDNEAEAAWERHQQDLMENGPGPSLRDQQEAARKLK